MVVLQRDTAGCDQHAAQYQQPPGGVHHPHHEEVGQGQPRPCAIVPVLSKTYIYRQLNNKTVESQAKTVQS